MLIQYTANLSLLKICIKTEYVRANLLLACCKERLNRSITYLSLVNMILALKCMFAVSLTFC
jgi:hypothetical protein